MIRGACRVCSGPGGLGGELRGRLELNLDLRLVPEGSGAWRIEPTEQRSRWLGLLAPQGLAVAALAVALGAAGMAAWGMGRTDGHGGAAAAPSGPPVPSRSPLPPRPQAGAPAPEGGSSTPARHPSARPGAATAVVGARGGAAAEAEAPQPGGTQPRVSVVSPEQLEQEALEQAARLERAQLEPEARLGRARPREQQSSPTGERRGRAASIPEPSGQPLPGPGPARAGSPAPRSNRGAPPPAPSPVASGLDLFDDTR